jgi:PAS domain S-box-containing protein
MDLTGLYRGIVETSPDGIWVFDLEGRTLYANPELGRLLGATPEELAGLTVFDALDETGRAQFGDHLAALRGGHVNDGEVECRLVRRDGTTLWVIVRESRILGDDGTLTGILHRVSDYHERRQVVEELRTSQRRLAEAHRIARIGSWEWDVDKDEISGSEELYELYGLDPASFPAAYDSFLQIVHEDDRAHVDAEVQAALRSGGEFGFMARVQGRDGWVWTRGRGLASPDETGRVVSMSGTHQDVTETKHTESALEDQVTQNTLMQAVASTANEGHTLAEVLGQARSLVLLHDDWARARAFMPAEGPDGEPDGVVPLYISQEDEDADLATPETSAMELALAARAFRERRSVWDDARLTIAFPISFADEVCAVVTITSDPPLYRHDMIQQMAEQMAVQLGRVAERERSAQALADARDDAMEASRQKSEFLATMSHEIRTPLNGVIGLNDLLMRTHLDADQLRLASGVQVASRALLGVINDILDFSKIEAGRLELEQLDFEVRAVFDQVASVLSETARAKGLVLMVSCHPDVPEVLCGDPTRLAQVLTNLGSNAVKFTESGEVSIRATAEPLPGGRTGLRVEVSDTGVGIEDLEGTDLFEAFTQADASTTRRYGGTGLGLAISREIVSALGGEIGMGPNPGGGSVFWFTAVFDAPTVTGADAHDVEARALLDGRRILVVDDNAQNRLILEEQLAWWRARAYGVAGSSAALIALAEARAEGDPFEAVLLDMSMPGGDGVSLAGQVRSDPAYDAVTLLMLTSTTVPDVDRLRATGIAECLTKPVLAAGLRAALLRHVAGVELPRPLSPAATSPGRYRPRVLVVEDNPVNQLVAVGLLEALGYVAETAEDGVAALEVFDHGSFDAVLMDVQMPRLDGYATTRELRTRGHHLPIIAMTAAAVEGERERCLGAGMDDFLTKPVDPSALSAVLDLWLADDLPAQRRLVAAVDGAAPDARQARPTAPVQGLELDRLDELRDLDPGVTTYLDRAIGNFVANTPGAMAALREAVAGNDTATLKQVAHKLAGGALNLGVVEAGRAAQAIELVSDSGSTEEAAPLLDGLEDALARGREALLAYQASYSQESARA